ncbi:MAG: hypothetical protein NTV88_06075 [Candidatus Micrarchaeota archaeon]|nr:hypothetical protein [Candidatus Micrarchaeota archaeon]
MLIFQVFAGKKKDDEEQTTEGHDPRFGIRLRKVAKFLKAHLEGGEMPLEAAEVATAVRQAQKYFERNNLSDFMTTLTPGAQNAIYAGSFLWGYENAAKYVKNAMKLVEAKNDSMLDTSKEILKSVQGQASQQNELVRSSEKIIWTFYNESLKDFQKQVASTEIMVEKPGIEQQTAPLTAKDAIAQSIEQNSSYPALLYCVSMKEIERELEEKRSDLLTEKKKEELVRLETQQVVKIGEEEIAQIRVAQVALRKELNIIASMPDTKQKEEQLSPGVATVSEPALAASIKRHQELISEYARTECAIEETLSQLEIIRGNDEARIRATVDANLPPQLAQIILRKKELAKRIALQKQLKKWLVFCGKGKGEASKISRGKIAKLLSLTQLLKK